tara:strand:+ start:7316 stop:7717 length:402 start_codon:yes stop_codon:yes gene_type:complete
MRRSPIKQRSDKKVKARKTTAGALAASHMMWIKGLDCECCGRSGPSDAHHAYHDRYGTAKRSDWLTVPLCKICHQYGAESVHKAKTTWLEKHGPDWLMAIRLIERSPFRDLAPMEKIYAELPSTAKQDKSVIF